MKIRMILMALAALLCLASCSDDDSGIQLTKDEVTGDIITGKQIVINTQLLLMIVLPRFRVLQMSLRRRYT